MRTFLQLLHKEWRDHRVLILTWAGLSPLIARALQWAFLDENGDEIVGRFILPGLTLVLLVALAADLVAREVEAGVGDSLGRLPVRPSALWSAKLLVLTVVGALAMVWMPAVELAWRGLTGRPTEEVLEAFREAHGVHTVLATGTAIVFACGVLLRRALPAAVVALAVTLGLLLSLKYGARTEEGGRVLAGLSLWPRLWWPAVIAGAFLFASWLAYRPWRSRPGEARRRLALFAGGLFLLMAPASVAAVHRYRAEMTLVMGDPRVRVGHFAVSPDERRVAVQVSKVFRGWGRIEECWVLDLENGAYWRAPAVNRGWIARGYGDDATPWTSEGRLRLLRTHAPRYALWGPGGDLTLLSDEDGVRDPRWCRFRKDREGYRVTWEDRGIEVLFPPPEVPVAGPEPGVLFRLDAEGCLLRHDLVTETARVLGEGYSTRTWPDVAPDGGRLAMADWQRKETRYLDPRTGEPLIEPLAGWGHQQWTGLADPWAVCYSRERPVGSRYRVLLIGDGERRELILGGYWLHVFDWDRILVLEDGGRLVLVDGEGRALRTVFPAGE